jgi:hypothetical protein
MKIELTALQRAQLEPVKLLLDRAPKGTSTLAQIIWEPSGKCVCVVAVINAAPFQRIWNIATKPGACCQPTAEDTGAIS